MKNERGFIQYIILIAVILAVVFLSQQPQFRASDNSLYQKSIKAVNAYMAEAKTWFLTNVYPKVSGEAGSIKTAASKTVTNEKNNLAENLWQQLKNYFAQKFSKIFGTSVQ